LKKTSSLNEKHGCTDEETVKLDFDDTLFKTVKYWALRAMKRFKLEGFIILKSSKKCYHVVFNRKVTWKENMSIVAWVTLHNITKRKVVKWFLMQCIKGGSTLRISPKRDKGSPRIVFRHGRENGQVEGFLRFRQKVKNIIRRLKVEVNLLLKNTVSRMH